jgi:transcriptional regulator with XRE-family HTH domain
MRGRRRVHQFEPTKIGRNLARLRTKHGLSQPALAGMVTAHGTPLPANWVSRVESGEIREPAGTTLKAIADALEEPVAEFWANPDDPRDRLARETYEEFLRTEFAADMTPEEREILPSVMWRAGVPTVRGWYHALQMLRATKRR